jgi:hypothetical protein
MKLVEWKKTQANHPPTPLLGGLAMKKAPTISSLMETIHNYYTKLRIQGSSFFSERKAKISVEKKVKREEEKGQILATIIPQPSTLIYD